MNGSITKKIRIQRSLMKMLLKAMIMIKKNWEANKAPAKRGSTSWVKISKRWITWRIECKGLFKTMYNISNI